MKKKWYDYLWIASLTYLVLGFFNILFAWLGLLCFFIPAGSFRRKGHKGLLQPLLRAWAAVQPVGRPVRSFPQAGYPALDEEQGLPLRFSNLFLCDVFSDALEHLSGFRRRGESKTSGNPAVDVQASLAMGLSWYALSPRCRAVRLRLL